MSAPDPALLSSLRLKLRDAFKLVRGLRKQISEADEETIARSLLEQLGRSGYRLVRDPPGPGLHVFRAPENPRDAALMTIRHALVRAQKALVTYLDPGAAEKKTHEELISNLAGILDDRALLDAIAATADDAPSDSPGP